MDSIFQISKGEAMKRKLLSSFVLVSFFALLQTLPLLSADQKEDDSWSSCLNYSQSFKLVDGSTREFNCLYSVVVGAQEGTDSLFNATIVVDGGYITNSYGWVSGSFIESGWNFVPGKKMDVDQFITTKHPGIKLTPLFNKHMSFKAELSDPSLSIVGMELYNTETNKYSKAQTNGDEIILDGVPTGKYQLVVETKKGLFLHNFVVNKAG